MSTNKKSTASQALLDMDNIIAAIKEESKKSLGTMLNEAVRDVIREECNEDDDEYTVLDNDNDTENDAVDNDENNSEDTVDGGTDDAQQNSDNTDVQADNTDETDDVTDDNEATEPTDGAEAPESDDQGDSEGSFDEFADFETSDGVYDLSGEKDSEKAVRAFKLLNNDDILLVKKGDGTLKLKDNEAGTEYLIDLGTDDDAEGDDEGQPQATSLNESEDNIAGLPSDDLGDNGLEDPTPEATGFDSGFDDNAEGGFTPDGEEPMGGDIQPTNDVYSKIDDIQRQIDSLKARKQVAENKNKKARKPMKESKEVLFEVDLGYTDNYQDKDPIKGLSNNEPSKSGRSWHKGVPTGTEKPWAGDSKSKGAPFSKTQKVEGSVNEEFDNVDLGTDDTMEEATNVGGAVQQRTSSKSHIPAGREQYGPKTKRHVSAGADYKEQVAEMAAIKKENRELKEAIQTLKKNLTEAYITNVNLGKITKLFLENATSQQEKIDIVNRFSNEAKTVEQSKALFESINKELKKKGTSAPSINETSMTVNGTKTLNESAPYKSNDFLKTIDLMNRMKNC